MNCRPQTRCALGSAAEHKLQAVCGAGEGKFLPCSVEREKRDEGMIPSGISTRLGPIGQIRPWKDVFSALCLVRVPFPCCCCYTGFRAG